MTRELKKIIQQYGVEILRDSEAFERVLKDSSVSTRNIYGIMLIIRCSPLTVDFLCQKQIGEVEGHSLIENVIRNTGLSIGEARYLVGSLMIACEIRNAWPHLPLLTDEIVSKDMKPEDFSEQKLQMLINSLEKEETSEVIAAMDDLARSGCAKAAYALGMHYRKTDLCKGTDDSVYYFKIAAEVGFGPANGALAEREINREKKRLWRAIKYFQRPTTLSGKEGREWIPLSTKLLEYRKENETRVRTTLLVQIIVLMMSLAVICVLGIAPGFWRMVAIGIQVIGIGWSIMCRFFYPYYTTSTAGEVMILSWIILVFLSL